METYRTTFSPRKGNQEIADAYEGVTAAADALDMVKVGANYVTTEGIFFEDDDFLAALYEQHADPIMVNATYLDDANNGLRFAYQHPDHPEVHKETIYKTRVPEPVARFMDTIWESLPWEHLPWEPYATPDEDMIPENEMTSVESGGLAAVSHGPDSGDPIHFTATEPTCAITFTGDPDLKDTIDQYLHHDLS